MAPLCSQTSLTAFTVLMLVLISQGAGLRFTQQDYESRSHSALLQGIREFSIEETELFSDVESTEDLPSDEVTNLKKCSCKGTTCGCCLHAKMKKIGLDADVCLDISYLPKEIGIQVQLTVDKKVVFTKKVSAKNPPAICADMPGLKKMASICIRFYDLNVSGKQLSGCVELQARLAKVFKEKVKIGCFKIPPKFEDIGLEFPFGDSSNGYQVEEMALPHEIQQVDQLVPETNQKPAGKSCNCKKDSCLCCAHLKGDEFLVRPQAEVCLNTSLLPEVVGFQANLSVNGNTILKRIIATQSPSPVCVTFTMQVGICLKFKNLHISKQSVEGCAEVDLQVKGKLGGKVDLGCFKIPPKDLEISSEYSLSEVDNDDQIEQVALPMNLKQSYKLSFEFTEESSGKPCSCVKDSCQCCARLNVGKLHLNSQVCFKASFLPKEIGFQAEVTVNGKSIFKKKITAQNPPPICGTLKKSIQLCLVFKNLHISGKKLEGCVEVDVKMGIVTVAKVSLGCFKMPPMEYYRRLEVLKQLGPALVQTLMKGIVEEEESVMPLNNAEDSLQSGNCQIGKDSYSCCIHFSVLHKKRSVCVKIVFLPNILGVDLQLLFDGKVIFHDKVKVNNPPPFCVPIPFGKSASVCLKLNNLQLHKDSVSGCVEVDVKFKNLTINKFNLGCFQLPPKVESQDLIGFSVQDYYFD